MRITHTSGRRFVLAATMTIGVTAATSACGGTDPQHGTPDAATTTPIDVTAVAAMDADVPETFEAGGVVRARTTTTIAARVMAPVLSVTARAGDRVRRGATLVTLDARELSAHVARNAASLQAAEEAARAAQAQVSAAEAGLTLAQATHDRILGLHGKKSATAQELDQTVATLRAAEAQLASARAQSLAAGATRDAARAGADVAHIGLTYTVLAAPFDGVVAARMTDPGSLATPGAPLLVLEESGPVRLEATLDEARAGGIAVGQSVDVRIDGSGDTWQPGRVAELGRLDPATHSFIVKIDLPAGEGRRTGAFGRARFAGTARRALTVPASSLVRRGQLAFVYVVEDSTRARLRPVTPGPAFGDRTEILAGLTAGESVLAAPPPALRDGAAIAIGPRAATDAGGR